MNVVSFNIKNIAHDKIVQNFNPEEIPMSKIEKVLATGKTHTTHSAVDGHNGNLDIVLSSPGSDTPAHVLTAVQPHPKAEQLFAGAWSACYIAAVGLVAQQMKVTLPTDTAVDIEVDLGPVSYTHLTLPTNREV